MQFLKRKRVFCPFLNALSLLIRNLGGLGVGEAAHKHYGHTSIGYMVEPTYENKLPN